MSLLSDNATIDWRFKFWKKINKKIEDEYKKHSNLDQVDCFICNGSGKILNHNNESVQKIKTKTINNNLTDLQKKQIIKETRKHLMGSESEEKLSDVLKKFGL